MRTDILIVGGGMGGCAAAMSATSLGYHVVLTEPTKWIGGQLTSQAVPPDSHKLIETTGRTLRYHDYREAVRKYYRDCYRLTQTAFDDPLLNPGGGTVSRLCHEPRAALAVLKQKLAFAQTSGRLRILEEHRPIAVDCEGDHVRSVLMEDLRSGDQTEIEASFIIDATELGELLPLAGVEYVTGAEARSETDEPHAAEVADPTNTQGFTWCLAMGYDPSPDADHTISRPAEYEYWQSYVPDLTPKWTGRLFDWIDTHPHTLEPRQRVLFPKDAESISQSLWLYRRIVAGENFDDPSVHDVSIMNWPQNDYSGKNIIDEPKEVVQSALNQSRSQSLSLLYWLQTDAPRPDGGVGYPGLYPCPEMTGTKDGLAMQPYVRESRRIRSRFTVTENHVGLDARRDAGLGMRTQFNDSVGIGFYNIDLHPSVGGDNSIGIPATPFQIPLGSLIPQRIRNLLPGCKNIGTTHITNGCYREHPLEWNIGEVVGLLSGHCLTNHLEPHQVYEQSRRLKDFQNLLCKQGIDLDWPDHAFDILPRALPGTAPISRRPVTAAAP